MLLVTYSSVGWCCLPPPSSCGAPIGRCFPFSGTSPTQRRARPKGGGGQESPTRKGGEGKEHHCKGRGGTGTRVNWTKPQLPSQFCNFSFVSKYLLFKITCVLFCSNERDWPPHPMEVEESNHPKRRKEGDHHQLWVVLVFSLSFSMVLPFFPSFGWSCFSPLFWCVVLLGLLLLGRGAFTTARFGLVLLFLGTSITQSGRKAARPKRGGCQAAPPKGGREKRNH